MNARLQFKIWINMSSDTKLEFSIGLPREKPGVYAGSFETLIIRRFGPFELTRKTRTPEQQRALDALCED